MRIIFCDVRSGRCRYIYQRSLKLADRLVPSVLYDNLLVQELHLCLAINYVEYGVQIFAHRCIDSAE